MDFLMVFGVERWSDLSSLDGEVITAAAQKHLIGKPLKDIDFPKETQPVTCVSKTLTRLDCEFWFIKGPIRETGFHVVMRADNLGNIQSTEVSNMYRILGRWRVV